MSATLTAAEKVALLLENEAMFDEQKKLRAEVSALEAQIKPISLKIGEIGLKRDNLVTRLENSGVRAIMHLTVNDSTGCTEYYLPCNETTKAFEEEIRGKKNGANMAVSISIVPLGWSDTVCSRKFASNMANSFNPTHASCALAHAHHACDELAAALSTDAQLVTFTHSGGPYEGPWRSFPTAKAAKEAMEKVRSSVKNLIPAGKKPLRFSMTRMTTLRGTMTWPNSEGPSIDSIVKTIENNLRFLYKYEAQPNKERDRK